MLWMSWKKEGARRRESAARLRQCVAHGTRRRHESESRAPNSPRRQFARQISETSSQLADAERIAASREIAEANRKVARAEDVVAYVGHRYERASAPKSRFRDYFRPRQKEMKELTAVRNSAFFDREFYLDSNPDVRASGMDAALHYLVCGGREGRDPGPFFSTHEYLARFPDVAASGMNALAHYEMYGRR